MHENNTVNVDSFDIELFREVAEANAKVRSLRSVSDSEAFTDLLVDGFGAFYKHDPKVKEEVPPERRLNKKIIEQMMTLKEYRHLRQFTLGDEFNSVASLDAVREIFEKVPKETRELQKEMERTREELNQALDALANAAEGGDSELSARARSLISQLAEMESEMEGSWEECLDDVRMVGRRALERAAEEAVDQETALKAFGWGREDGTGLVNAWTAEKIELAKKLREFPKLREIAQMAGRFVNIAREKQRSKTEYFRQEVAGIETGNEIADLVPSEFLLLTDPDLEYLFYKKYFERELTQYRMQGRTPEGRGPIVVAVDVSGSMFGAPNIWASAVALALFAIARDQNRDFRLLLFNTKVVGEASVLKGQRAGEDLIRLLLVGPSGGTAYEPPLSRALDVFLEAEFKRADLIFITDGLCKLKDGFLETWDHTKREREFSVITIWINLLGGSISKDSGTVFPFADRVVDLRGDLLNRQGEAFEVAFTI